MNIAFTATLSDRVIDRDTLPPPPRAFTAGISGFSYEDLRDVAQLPRLMEAFDAHARAVLDPGLWDRFVAYRQVGALCGREARLGESAVRHRRTRAPSRRNRVHRGADR